MALICLGMLVAGAGLAWSEVFGGRPPRSAEYYQLDVGQGDAEIARLSGGALFMTDAGPDGRVAEEMERILPGIRHIDIAVISHPQLDHFNGYRYLLDKYSFGAFIINGRADGGTEEWSDLISKIRSRGIPLVTLGAGDRVEYGNNQVRFLSPGSAWLMSAELNDTALVEHIITPEWSALLTGDIGSNVERYLFASGRLDADILKVGHHGSKYSTGNALLRSIGPKVAVISSGKKNRYGHPASSTLGRLREFDIPHVRTDEIGSLVIRREGDTLIVEPMK